MQALALESAEGRLAEMDGMKESWKTFSRVGGIKKGFLPVDFVLEEMRRFLSLKNLGEKKVVCTVQEMDNQTARLIGDRDDAHKEMSALWKQAADVKEEVLNERVTTILKTYEQKSEDVLKDRNLTGKALLRVVFGRVLLRQVGHAPSSQLTPFGSRHMASPQRSIIASCRRTALTPSRVNSFCHFASGREAS